MIDSTSWRGIAIEEGFSSPAIPPGAQHVSMRTGPLSGERAKGPVHLHAIIVEDNNLRAVTEWACRNLRPGWYMHLVKGRRMRVIFRDHVFDISKNNHEEIDRVRQFGIQAGVHPKQLPFERLFDDPFS